MELAGQSDSGDLEPAQDVLAAVVVARDLGATSVAPTISDAAEAALALGASDGDLAVLLDSLPGLVGQARVVRALIGPARPGQTVGTDPWTVIAGSMHFSREHFGRCLDALEAMRRLGCRLRGMVGAVP